MSQLPIQSRLLQCFIKALAEAEIAPREMRSAAKMLRSGILFERAAKILDIMALSDSKTESSSPNSDGRTSQPSNRNAMNAEVDLAMQLLKRRKIIKDDLVDILRQVDSRAVLDVVDTISIRDLLRHFRGAVSDNDWKLLIDILSGDAEFDPFLRGILDR